MDKPHPPHPILLVSSEKSCKKPIHVEAKRPGASPEDIFRHLPDRVCWWAQTWSVRVETQPLPVTSWTSIYVFQHTPRPWDSPFPPLGGQGREINSMKDIEFGWLRKCKITTTVPTRRRTHCKVSPPPTHRPAIIMSAQTGHTPTNHFCPGRKTGLCTDTVLTSRFARIFRFTWLISRQNTSEETA